MHVNVAVIAADIHKAGCLTCNDSMFRLLKQLHTFIVHLGVTCFYFLFYNLCFCEVDIIGSRLYIDSSELEIEPRPSSPLPFIINTTTTNSILKALNIGRPVVILSTRTRAYAVVWGIPCMRKLHTPKNYSCKGIGDLKLKVLHMDYCKRGKKGTITF